MLGSKVTHVSMDHPPADGGYIHTWGAFSISVKSRLLSLEWHITTLQSTYILWKYITAVNKAVYSIYWITSLQQPGITKMEQPASLPIATP